MWVMAMKNKHKTSTHPPTMMCSERSSEKAKNNTQILLFQTEHHDFHSSTQTATVLVVILDEA